MSKTVVKKTKKNDSTTAAQRIISQDDKRLRQISDEVPLKEIKSLKIKKVIKDMSESLNSQHDGVAIAAPQIGVNLRMFMVSGKIFETKEENESTSKIPNQVYINPEIIKFSKKTVLKEGEGCLSVRWLYGKVVRHTNVTINYYDADGVLNTRGAGGLLAHIFQHEMDHLNGVLFIDKATDVEEILPEELEAK